MTAQGLECGVRPVDVINALSNEINRLYGYIMPNVGFHPHHPALMPQAFQPLSQAPLVAQTYQPRQQRTHPANPIGHAHFANSTQHACDAPSPITQSIEHQYPGNAYAMAGNIEEAPQHGFLPEMFNPAEPDPVVEAIRRLQAVESAQLNSPRSPSF